MKLFFFGAGASKASGLALTAELAPALYQPQALVSLRKLKLQEWEAVYEEFEADRLRSTEFLESIRGSDPVDTQLLRKGFEIISRCLEGGSGHGGHTFEQIKQIQTALVNAFTLLLNPGFVHNCDTQAYMHFVKWAASQDERTVMVSTNWDMLLDNLVDVAYLNGSIDRGMVDLPVDRWHMQSAPLGGGQRMCALYKLNGSVNWLICPRHLRFYGMGFQEPYNLEATVWRQQTQAFLLDSRKPGALIPAELQIGHCPRCGSRLEHRLYTPGLARTQLPVRPRMLSGVRFAVEQCRELVFIGFSCPPEDADVMRCIREALHRNPLFESGELRPLVVQMDGPHADSIRQRYERALDCTVAWDGRGFVAWARSLTYEERPLLIEAVWRLTTMPDMRQTPRDRAEPVATAVAPEDLAPRRAQLDEHWAFLKDEPNSSFDHASTIRRHNRACALTDESDHAAAEQLFREASSSFLDAVGFRFALYEALEGHLVMGLPLHEVGMLDHLGLDNVTVLFLLHVPWWSELATCLCQFGKNLRLQGRLDEASVLTRQALSIWEVFGEGNLNLAQGLTYHAEVLNAQGDLETARGLLSRAVELSSRVLGESSEDSVRALLALADNLGLSGLTDEARDAASLALERMLKMKSDHAGAGVGEVVPWLTECLARCLDFLPPEACGEGLARAALHAESVGLYQLAEPLYLKIFADSPQAATSEGQAILFGELSERAMKRRDLDAMEYWLSRALDCNRQTGQRFREACTLAELGVLAMHQDDAITAGRWLLEAAQAFAHEQSENGLAAVRSTFDSLLGAVDEQTRATLVASWKTAGLDSGEAG